MSVIWHLVRHDIRALRLPLLAWLVVLLAQSAMVAAGPGLLDPEERAGLFVALADFLAVARLAFTILLTVLIVQRDSPVGTTAFWLTRPIPPVALAAGKLCSAGLSMVALPAAVGWALFSFLGLPQADVIDGIRVLGLEQTLLVSFSAMGAAITASIPQFAVVAVAAVLLVGAMTNQLRPYLDRLPLGRTPVEISPIAAWTCVTVAGTAAVVAYQYSRRRTLPAAASVAAVLVLGVTSALTTRGSFVPPPAASLRAGALDPAAVVLGVEPSRLRIESGATSDRQGRQMRYRYATAILRTAGVPPEIVLQPSSVDSVWYPAGTTPIPWQTRRAAYRTTVQREDEADGQPLRSLALGLGDEGLVAPTRSGPTAFRTTLLSVHEEAARRFSPPQGPLDATVTLRAWRYRVVDAVPLAVGNALTAREGRLTVREIARRPDDVQVDVRHVFFRRMFLTAEDEFGSGGVGSAEYIALRNRSKVQSVLVTGSAVRSLSYSFPPGFSGAQLGTAVQRMRFVVPFDDKGRVTLDEEWLKDAELVVLRPEDLGVFARPLRLESVSLADAK